MIIESEEITLKTNTAYLLNDWFKEPTMWKKVRSFIEKKHEEHWKGLTDGFVEVTFKIKMKDKNSEGKHEKDNTKEHIKF